MEYDLEALWTFSIALQELAKAQDKDAKTIERKWRFLLQATRELKEKCPFMFGFNDRTK